MKDERGSREGRGESWGRAAEGKEKGAPPKQVVDGGSRLGQEVGTCLENTDSVRKGTAAGGCHCVTVVVCHL